MSPPQSGSGFPPVYVRLRVIQSKPALPLREVFQEIWASGPRFHVRDESGRDLTTLIEDVRTERGLGVDPQSMEEIMDRWSQSTRAPFDSLDLFGNLSTGEGVVCRTGEKPWHTNASKLVPLVNQIFAAPSVPEVERRGTIVRLERECLEYHDLLIGTVRGVPYQSEVTQLVSGGYLMLNVVRDVRNSNHSLTREIVTLREGNIQEHDLIPPEIAH